MTLANMIIGLCVFGGGFALAYWLKGRIVSQKIKSAEEEAQQIIDHAKRQSETMIKEVEIETKDKLYNMMSEFENETKGPKYRPFPQGS